jgi:hypothetical protein
MMAAATANATREGVDVGERRTREKRRNSVGIFTARIICLKDGIIYPKTSTTPPIILLTVTAS